MLKNVPAGEYVVTLYYSDATIKRTGVRVTAGRPVFLMARFEGPPWTPPELVPERSHVVPSPAPCTPMSSKMADC
jgi:hypothetical protein